MMHIDLITMRLTLRAVLKGLDVEETLRTVEVLLDDDDGMDLLECTIKSALEGKYIERAPSYERMQGDGSSSHLEESHRD